MGTARKANDGTYRLSAEKWYCSATDEFFLLAARPEGAPEGTAGVAIFFVPRLITENGKERVNNISIRRLKDKLGTQALPTAEIDFEDAAAYLLGTEEEGFSLLMSYVLNCSRIHNAANALGFARRAFAEARHYARERIAFGKPIISYPMVQQSLLGLQQSLTASRSLFFAQTARLDRLGLVPEDRDEALWQRFYINLLKYRTAVRVTERVKDAILVLGANGIIQDFSILPRLLRDSIVIETWEGTHNILTLQILKDARRFNFWERLRAEIVETLKNWPKDALPQTRALFQNAVAALESTITPDNLQNPAWVATHARRLIDRIGALIETGCLIREGLATGDGATLLIAAGFAHDEFSGDGFTHPLYTTQAAFLLPLLNDEVVRVDLSLL